MTAPDDPQDPTARARPAGEQPAGGRARPTGMEPGQPGPAQARLAGTEPGRPGPARPTGTVGEQPAEADTAILPLPDASRTRLPSRHAAGAYWAGFVLLVLGLAAMAIALAGRVTSVVQAVLLAVPVLCIGLGLERVGRGVGRRSLRAAGGVLAVAAVVVPVLLALFSPGPGVLDRVSAPVPGTASTGVLRASLGGGQLHIGPSGGGLYEADLRSPSRPRTDVSTSGNTTVVDLRAAPQHGLLARNRGSDWVVGLSTSLPWRVEVDTGVITADVDLQQLDVRGLRVDAGVSRVVVRLGGPAARVPVNVQVAAGLVDLYLPRSAACQIEVDGLAVNNFAAQGLGRGGSGWRVGDVAGGKAYTVRVRISGGRVRIHRT